MLKEGRATTQDLQFFSKTSEKFYENFKLSTMISLNKFAGNVNMFIIIIYIILSFVSGTRISTQLIALSLRNLSISSNSQTTNNPFLIGKLDNQEFSLQPLIAKQNTNFVKDIGINCPVWRRKEIFELPLTNKIVENPTQGNKIIEEITNIEKTISLPDNNKSEDDIGKQAKNGMIMIRRRKMRKHKLRKLRKRMKYEWAKVSQLTELYLNLQKLCNCSLIF